MLCEYAISEVDKLIEDKKNEDEIKSVLDKICYELRFVNQGRTNCSWTVPTYGLAVIEIAVICLCIALLVGKRKQNYFGLKS